MTYSDGQTGLEPCLGDRLRLRLLTGLIALLTSVLALVMFAELQRYPYPPPFHDGIQSPVLAVELARDKESLKAILGTYQPVLAANGPMSEAGSGQDGHPSAFDRFMTWEAVSSLKANTVEDLAFIPLYALFVWCFALLMTASADRGGILLARAVGTLILIAAMLDYLEDYGIFSTLGAEHLTDDLARHTRFPSLGKWGLIAVCLLLLAVILLRSSVSVYKRGTRLLLAVLCTASGLLMLIALRWPQLMFPANSLFGIFVLLNAGGLLGVFLSEKAAADASVAGPGNG